MHEKASWYIVSFCEILLLAVTADVESHNEQLPNRHIPHLYKVMQPIVLFTVTCSITKPRQVVMNY